MGCPRVLPVSTSERLVSLSVYRILPGIARCPRHVARRAHRSESRFEPGQPRALSSRSRLRPVTVKAKPALASAPTTLPGQAGPSTRPAPTSLGYGCAGFLSDLLRSDGVDSLLWGNLALAGYGVPVVVETIDLIIEDDRFAVALDVLQRAGIVACGCRWPPHFSTSPELFPVSDAHFDIRSMIQPNPSRAHLHLWRTSSALGAPKLPASEAFEEYHPSVCRDGEAVYDPPLPSDATTEWSTVKVPTLPYLLRTYLGRVRASPLQLWRVHVGYIWEYCDDEGRGGLESALDGRDREDYRLFKDGCLRSGGVEADGVHERQGALQP